uniref:Elongation of fatty acids protein n=1 Tax=Spongospora subterranea TaxID=70186 RepID=A0A0H5R5N0_9EUKA|eukprot:CRZ09465.1 hypothetical protein [Spongospora subterranea]
MDDLWSWNPSPLTDGWPLVDAKHAFAALLCYMVGIPMLMAWVTYRGKGYNIKPYTVFHNITMFALSLYMCINVLYQAVKARYSLFGNAVDHSPSGLGMASVIWLFFISKAMEFGDTAIMALRHRFRQITFLHVYHHASIFSIWWIIAKYHPGGESYFTCALNSAVHVVMYGYYLWSSVSTPAKPITWRKPEFYRPYITRIQLSQFVIMLGQATYDCLVPSEYPKQMAMLLFAYMLTMLFLFANFYVKSYQKKREKQQ